MSLATILLGPLAGPECRRALARGWLIVVRTLVAAIPALIILGLLWAWWIGNQSAPNPMQTFGVLARLGLSAEAMILLTIAVVQAPALLAGSLAGERERGVLQLFLTTDVTAREVVLGRLAGKLSQVGMIVLAGVPTLALLASWNGFTLIQFTALLALLAAVGAGAGGMAIGASVVSRRGRDALLSVYILILCLLLLCEVANTSLKLPAAVTESMAAVNPFITMGHLVETEEIAPAAATTIIWLVLGIAGVTIASLKLRSSCLAATENVKKSRRSHSIPAVDDRPMLWKELYIERVGTLGRLGRWLGVVLVTTIGGGSLVLAGLSLWDQMHNGQTGGAKSATGILTVLDDPPGMFLGWLLQWAVGLRAAVSIAAERERGSWDALLMSPLEPGEIVEAKILGSLRALRYLVGAFVLAWTIAWILGAVSGWSYLEWGAGNAVAALFMAAVGLRCSLGLPSATRAMTWTIAIWLIGKMVVAILAGCLIAAGAAGCVGIWSLAVQNGLIPIGTAPWFPIRIRLAWPVTTDLVTLLFAIFIVLQTRLRFDRIAGRMAGGKLAVTVEEFLNGRTTEPVFLPARKPLLSDVSWLPRRGAGPQTPAADAIAPIPQAMD